MTIPRAAADSAPALGIRAWPDGAAEASGQTVNDSELIAAIHAALDGGVNYVESAGGAAFAHVEEVVGKALAGRRDTACVVGVCRSQTPVARREQLDAQIDNSLRRLRCERLDLYFCQWPDVSIALEELMSHLQRRVERGDLGAIGLSGYGCEQLSAARRCGPLAAVRCRLSLLEQSDLIELIPYCQEHRLAVVAADPLFGGQLGTPRTGTALQVRAPAQPVNKRVRANLNAMERLAGVAAAEGRSLTELALGWVISQPAVGRTVVRCARPSDVRDLISAREWTISRTAAAQLVDILSERDRELDR